MAFSSEKRNEIKKYLLEKIFQNEVDFVKKTAENFNISKNTVYRYVKELKDDNILTDNQNGTYKLVEKSQEIEYILDGTLEEDIIFEKDILKYIEKLPKNVVNIWNYAFTEMFNNVIDHSLAEKVTCYVIQNFLYTWIIIMDDGVGIFKKIREYYKYDSLEEAITELFKGKLTTDSNNHSGEGIFFTSRVMDLFTVLSSGKIFAHDYSDSLSELKDVRGFEEWEEKEGTTVLMVMSNTSDTQLNKVFDQYADVDGGFTKTSIPIKSALGTSFPVSRSQAKRLCARFDKFKEVTLDFIGVEELGQGFAHEVFYVFQNNHPEIIIHKQNMNESVEKMINHVKNSK